MRALKDSGVEVVADLPDSVISDLIERIERDEEFRTIPVAREERAVAALSGAWLGGKRGALSVRPAGSPARSTRSVH